jgi:phage FluMu protein Com
MTTSSDGMAPAGGTRDDLRCLCGSLLARLVPEGVEVKCRRCKRRVVIPLSEQEPVRRAFSPGSETVDPES